MIKKIFYVIFIGLSLNINVHAENMAALPVASVNIKCDYNQAMHKQCTWYDIKNGLVITISNGFWAMTAVGAHQPRFLESVQIDDHPPIRLLSLNKDAKKAIEEMKLGKKITVTVSDALYGTQINTSDLSEFNAMLEQLQQAYAQF